MNKLSAREIHQKVSGVQWWHRININGLVTPGLQAPAAQEWISNAIDQDLTGLDVLDIGAWDGYYTFLAESRGARRTVAIDACQEPTIPSGFQIAKETLNSKAEYYVLDARELDTLEGDFDRIFFFGVYYHLEDPFFVLQQIFKKLKPGGNLLLEGLVRAGNKPYLYAYRPEDLEPRTYCAASVPWLILTCDRIGFSPVEFISRYSGDNFWERPVRALAWHLRLHWGRFEKSHRAIIRAHKPFSE